MADKDNAAEICGACGGILPGVGYGYAAPGTLCCCTFRTVESTGAVLAPSLSEIWGPNGLAAKQRRLRRAGHTVEDRRLPVNFDTPTISDDKQAGPGIRRRGSAGGSK